MRRPHEPVPPPAHAATTDGKVATITGKICNVGGSDVARRRAKSTSAQEKKMGTAPSLRDTPRGGFFGPAGSATTPPAASALMSATAVGTTNTVASTNTGAGAALETSATSAKSAVAVAAVVPECLPPQT